MYLTVGNGGKGGRGTSHKSHSGLKDVVFKYNTMPTEIVQNKKIRKCCFKVKWK